MQKLAEVCIRRPIFAAMIILALVVVGAASYFRLGVDRFPSVDLPTVRVHTILPGASPEEIESQISQRLEEAVNTVEGINELRSISGQGSSFVIVTFNLERDIDTATQDVRDRVATTLRDLPAGTDPPLISKFSNDLAPVMTMALSSPNRSDSGADRAGRQSREDSARTLSGCRRGDDCRRTQAGHQRLDRCRPPGGLQDPDYGSAQRRGAPECRCAGRECHRRRTGTDAAHHGPRH